MFKHEASCLKENSGKVLAFKNQISQAYQHNILSDAARGIAEYWIVDVISQKVTVLEWVEGFYEEKVYEDNQAIASLIFPERSLTTTQVLQQY